MPTVSTTDYHTAGEPFRIVAEPPVVIDGATSRRASHVSPSTILGQ